RQNGWIVGEFGKILRTKDGGETWKEQTKTLLEGTEFFDLLDLPTLFGVSARDQQNAVAAGLEAHIARTRDGGEKWTYDKVEGGEIKLVDPLYDIVEFPDGSGWAVGAAGQGVKTDGGSGVWTRAHTRDGGATPLPT